MKRALWIIGMATSALLGIGVVGLVGLVMGAGLIMAPPSAAQIDAVVPVAAPAHDPGKPTVAVLLGATRTEATDFLAPYAMFAESAAYNVYAVADSRAVRTLAGGVDVVPQLSFAELDARLGGSPDIIVVPAITSISTAENAPVLEWLREHGHGRSFLFSWCAGAEVLAASGLVDGRTVTTHWSDIDAFERAYPAMTWQRGQRYVDDGDVLTTGGITAGVDATLHLLATRNGPGVAAHVASAMHYPASPFVDDPRAPQYTFEAVDAAVYAHLAFGWAKAQAAIWLYDGVGEVDLAAAIEVYGLTSTNATTTVADATTVISQHGLQVVPRRQAVDMPRVDRMLVPGGDGATAAARSIPPALDDAGRRTSVLDGDRTRAYAFTLALQDLASSHDVMTAEYAARQLEVRSPLDLAGPRWPIHLLVVPVLAGIGGAGALWGLVRLGQRVRAKRAGRALSTEIGDGFAMGL